MAQNQQELRLLLTADVSGLRKSLRESKGDFGAMAESIRDTLTKLPKTGVMADAFKDDIKKAETLLKYLDRLEAKKAAGGTITPRENVLGTEKAMAFGETLADKAKIANLNQQKEAIDKLSLAQKTAYIESNLGVRENAAAVKYAQESIRKELKATQEIEKAGINQAKAILKENSNLIGSSITLRYALYDVAAGFKNAAMGVQEYSKATLGIAIEQQKAFSQIEKTQVGTAGEKQLGALRSQLLTLSTQIPKTFAELSKIGMLGAQLGIGAQDLDKFASTVAKFSTVTGVTVENAALAFGKLATTLKVAPEDFDKLGASIAYVGNTAAATEEQILSTARQISAVATAAGFSAAEVIGLASAMSSLSISPEEARGVLIPTFQAMDAAVRTFNESTQQGSEKLAVFAQLAGMSSAEFVKQWGDKSSGGATAVFQSFITGLGNTDAGSALQKLGLDGNRTSKGLTALGDSAGFAKQQIEDAISAMESGTFLDMSFAKTLDDLAAKLDMMKNSFDNLLAAISGGSVALGFIGAFVDLITMLNDGMRKLAESSVVAQTLMTVVTILTALTGAALALGGILLTAAGGFLAFRVAAAKAVDMGIIGKFAGIATTLFGIDVAAMQAAKGLTATAAAGTAAGAGLTATGIGARAAAIGMRVLQAAAGPIGIAVLAIGLLAEVTFDFFNKEEKATEATKDFADANADGVVDVNEMAAAIKDIVDEMKKFPNANRKVEDSLFSLGQSLRDNGKNFNVFSESGRKNMDALEGVIDAIVARGGGNADKIYADISNLMTSMQAQGLLTSDAMTYIGTVLEGLAPKLKTLGPLTGVFNISSAVDGFTKSTGKAKTALEKLQDQIESTFKTTVNANSVMDSLDALNQSLAENGKAFTSLSEGGRSNIESLLSVIDELAVKSNGDVKVFATSLASLKKALQDIGAPASAIKLIDKELKKLGITAKASASQVKQFTTALNSIGDGGLLAIADAASNLESRLSSLFSSVIAGKRASLELAAGYEEMADKIKQAKEEIIDINAEISTMTADKAILEYQLGIAIKYGDTLRANKIQAEIDKKNAAITKKNSELTAAQEQLTPTTAQSQLSLLNTLEQQANGIYTAFSRMLVQGDKNKTEMTTWVNEQTKLYYEQAIQAGTSEKEAATLAGTIKKDLTDAIKKTPKLAVDTKAANADIKALKDNIASITGKTVTITTRYVSTYQTIAATSNPNAGKVVKAAIGGLVTGPGTATSDSIPAQLSNGEFVMNAAAVQTYGVDFMNSLNNMRPIQAATTNTIVQPQAGSNMVYLSPEDRQILRSALDRPVTLYSNDQKIANSTNSGNAILAQRGLS